MGDFLDRVADIEDEFEDMGYAEGLRDGRKAGEIEGRDMGCEYGFGIGRDIGFYDGWVREWLKTADTHPDLVSERSRRQLESIQKLISDVPARNIESAHFSDRLKAIQRKFKAVSATLGVNVSAELPSNALSY
ncbi:hypothetical protein GQ54DRAFT_182461 [Martensiomyces pterosporus]|nr:hypothetical protein GQ54DRAFT_182461 [Martensiomyces pterosporus]